MTARAWSALIVIASFAATAAWAAPPEHGHGAEHGHEPPGHAERYDARYNHNRYYADHGVVLHQMPGRPLLVPHRGAPYYYSGGVWYAPHGPTFVVVPAPVGVFVPVLPPFYTTIWFAGVPYYYANDTYYSYRSEQGYEVVAPPGDQSVVEPEPPADAPPGYGAAPEPDGPPPESGAAVASGVGAATEELFVYPQNGQPPDKQASDKYECHQWAVSQTGFDPTQPAGGLPPDQLITKRADYQRADRACLEGRGYSVR